MEPIFFSFKRKILFFVLDILFLGAYVSET